MLQGSAFEIRPRSQSQNFQLCGLRQVGRDRLSHPYQPIWKHLHTPKTIRVPAITLDTLFEKYKIAHAGYNFINIDIQGAELLAFKGATKLLSCIDVIISEVNLVEMYENGALEGDIVAFLEQHGFERKHAIYHTLYEEDATFPAWGECLFVKR